MKLLFFFLVTVPATCLLFIFSITCDNHEIKEVKKKKRQN